MVNLSVKESIAKSEPPSPSEHDDWRRFFSFSTDHKVIGIQYIVTSFFLLFSRRHFRHGHPGGTDDPGGGSGGSHGL